MAGEEGGAGGGNQCEAGDDVPAACRDWVECDPCSSRCGCDAACIASCERSIYDPPTLSLANIPTARLERCGPEFMRCFAEPLGGVAGPGNCASLQACCVHRRGTAQDDSLCTGFVMAESEAECLLARYHYVTDGSCRTCDDPAVLAPECEDWAECDPCASKCACDAACLNGCRGDLFEHFLSTEQLFECSGAIDRCFTPPEEEPRFCALLEACCSVAILPKDDQALCETIVASRLEGACYALAAAYSRVGACPVLQ